MDPFPWFQRRIAGLLRLEQHPARVIWLRRLWLAWLLFHLTAVVLAAVPAPKPLAPHLLRRAIVQQELDRWYERVRAFGFSGDRGAFQDAVVRTTQVWSRTRRAVLMPLRSYLGVVRVRQGWYMFTAPDITPERFRVDAGRAGTKRGAKRPPKLARVFELGQPSNRPDLVPDSFLYHHRVRRALYVATWGKSDSHFQRLCTAFERRLARLDPKVRTVRCRMVRRDVEHPLRVGKKPVSRTVESTLRRVKR